MKKRKRKEIDPDMPVGKLTIIPDFLPPPEKLFLTESKLKITFEIEKETLEFFKKYAGKSGQKYQRLIREVLKSYAKRYK